MITMAYTDPLMTGLNDGGQFPIVLPTSGGVWITNPGVAEGGWYELILQDGSIAYYHADGRYWENFPN